MGVLPKLLSIKNFSKWAILWFVAVFVLSGFPIDQVKAVTPSITNVATSSVTTVSVTITWTTDINASSLVDYGLTTSYGNTIGDTSASTTDHVVVLEGLNPNTTYRFRVRSVDAMGDQAISDNAGQGFIFTTSQAPTISHVQVAEMTNNYVTITWQTDIPAYPFLAYGTTDSYGKLVGDEETLGTSHSISVAGLTVGTVYHYLPRVRDIYGNYTYYSTDSTFTTGAPYLQSVTSSTADGTYGPGSTINIMASYSENLAAGSTVTVRLDTGVDIVLDSLNNNTLSGTYTVGSTGSGQGTNDLTVASLVSQNVCDSNNYCHTGLTLPLTNIADGSDIIVDTVAPDFFSLAPANNSFINSINSGSFGSSDISYTISETLAVGRLTILREGGNADPASPHICDLSGTYLNGGVHANFNTDDCQGGAITLVDGAMYRFSFTGTDPAGNVSNYFDKVNITYDISAPVISSFTSTTADGIYGPTSVINITATYNEPIVSGSTITVQLNTGVQITLNNLNGNSLSGTYTVGATGSGQNTSDLAVASVVSQSVTDRAENQQTGTSLTGTNISDSSDIVIDTTAPDAPSTVLFVTDPINISNAANVTLRVVGEPNATILYSIDDSNPMTPAITGNTVVMESDGSTDITGLNLSSLNDGTLTATVMLRDVGLNVGTSSQDTVTKDTLNPTFTIQYYSDMGLTASLGNNPRLKVGTYYLKITSNEPLSSAPHISIAAQGTGNDITDVAANAVSGNDYRYQRTIFYDPAADGTSLEDISITGTDASGNTATLVNPTNEALKAAFNDTVKPTVTAVVNPTAAKAGTVNITLTFNEPMNQSVAPIVTVTKSDSSDLTASGGFSNATTWSGTVTVNPADANGTATLKVSAASDTAGNVMDNNSNVTTFNIDTINPSFTVNDGLGGIFVQTETVNVTVSDSGSGVQSQFYGFSADNVCDGSDTINTAFSSGVNFTISGDHTDYLCIRALDNANNVVYQSLGQLQTDNTRPTINSISTMHANGSFKAGEVIDIIVGFSEAVSSSGLVTVTLETGSTDRTCTFNISNSTVGSCNYIVQSGDNTDSLNVNSIAGTITDAVGNDMTNFTPASNLADSHVIEIDTLSPSVAIVSPTAGSAATGTTIITFVDNETTAPYCSLDNTNWVPCNTGSTTLSLLTGWSSLSEGTFTLYLRDTDPAGNIGTDSESGIIKDTNAPTILSVNSDHSNGSFKAGEVVDIDVTFSRSVTSTGPVTVTLETGTTDRSCTFNMDHSNFGTCNYVVLSGDTSTDLTVASISGVIYDDVGNAMTNYTPATNLAANKDIVIDTTAPVISDISSDHIDGTFNEGEIIDIDVTFSENITTSGFVTLTLDTGGSCTFNITDTSQGSCNYAVVDGQNSPDLNVVSITGVILDKAGNVLTNYTPVKNLAENKDIVIDTTIPGLPTITNITSAHANGSFKAGEVIDLVLNFSEQVTSTGPVVVTLETGDTDQTCSFSITNSTTGTCDYTVMAGDVSSDLNVLSVAGDVKDQAGNSMINFIPVVNLADNKDIVIDTSKPDAPVVSLTDPIDDSNHTSVSITGTGEANSTMNYSIDDISPYTSPVVKTYVVPSDGTINITENLGALDGGTITFVGTLTDAAGNVSDQTTVTVTSNVEKPKIIRVSSDQPNGYYKAGSVIDIDVYFSEPVTSTGPVTVTLETGETDQTCSFSVINADMGTCDYTVQPGDVSGDLAVQSVTGTIKDQADNVMVDFSLGTNLSQEKNIVIDTTVPSAPAVILTDPITDLNKNNVSITGVATGEPNALIHYSIDDANALTDTIVGSAYADIVGNINITDIDLGTLDGGVITAVVSVEDLAGNLGPSATITATSQVEKPKITSITSNHANGRFKAGETIDIIANFSENVTSSGHITINLETGTTDRYCSFAVTDANTGSCDYVVQEGDTSNDLNVISVEGIIRDQADNLMLNYTPETNLADNKDIIIDTTTPTLTQFSSTTANGIYGPGSLVNITAHYDENIVSGSAVTVMLNTGVQVVLDTVQNNNTLTGTYTVGATDSNQNTIDLSVAGIDSQNVCEVAENCLTEISLPSNNINLTSDIIIDTAGPVFSNILPNNSSNINSVTENSDIAFTLDEDMLWGRMTITRTAWAEDPASPHVCNFTGGYLEKGEHLGVDTTNCSEGAITLVPGAVYTFSFVGEDLHGNVGQERTRTGVTYGLDVVGPQISAISITNITSSSVRINWLTDEPADALVDYGTTNSYGKTEGDSSENKLDHSVLIDDLESGIQYYFRLRSSDSANNQTVEDNNGNGYTFTTSSLPSISGVQVINITDKSAVIKWTTDTSAYSYLDYGTTAGFGRIIGNEETLTTNHEVTVAGLNPTTLYYFRSRTKDIHGNYSIGGSGSFTTLQEQGDTGGQDDNTGKDTGSGAGDKNADSEPPSISSVSAKLGSNSSVTVTWRTDKDCNGMVRFGLDKNYGQSAAEDKTSFSADEFITSHEVIVSNLLSNATYHYSVVSYDASGNIATSKDYTFKTSALSSISDVKVTSISLNAVTIIWETGSPTTTEIEYGLTTAYGMNKVDKNLTNMHKAELVNLESGRTYHFRVKGVSADDSMVFSDDYIFATNSKPELESHEVGTITDSTVDLSWLTNVDTDSFVEYVSLSNPEDKGVQGLSEFFKNHKLKVTNLNQGTEYELKIKGTDANKESFESEPIKIKTDMDITAPVISQVNTESSLITGKEDKVQSIIYWKTDEASSSKVLYEQGKKVEGQDPSQESKEDFNLSTNHVIVLTNLKPGTVYNFKVISKDKNGNMAKSDSYSLLTPQKEKSVIQLIIANFEQTFGWMKKMKM